MKPKPRAARNANVIHHNASEPAQSTHPEATIPQHRPAVATAQLPITPPSTPQKSKHEDWKERMKPEPRSTRNAKPVYRQPASQATEIKATSDGPSISSPSIFHQDPQQQDWKDKMKSEPRATRNPHPLYQSPSAITQPSSSIYGHGNLVTPNSAYQGMTFPSPISASPG